MTAPDVSAVLAAIIPLPRTPLDDPCTCDACADDRRRIQCIADWRALDDATRTAAEMRRG